jgi:uncharacterized protein (UPF0303 family)
VLFKNSFEFHINQEIIDECGNFIILDINIQDYRMTLVAIYGPNEDNPDSCIKKREFVTNYYLENIKNTYNQSMYLEAALVYKK